MILFIFYRDKHPQPCFISGTPAVLFRNAMSRRAVLVLTGGPVTGIAAYIAYDYQTCYLFRKMKGYDLGGAAIRFHNQFRPTVTLQTMALKDLASFDGSNGRPTYFASDGYVWDVSASENFQKSYGLWKGCDATICLAKMTMNQDDINRTDWENLSEKELDSLRSWTRYFQEKYMIKARLEEYETNR